MSPEIISPETAPGQPYLQPADIAVLSIRGNDPDSENFWCFWTVRGEILPGDICDKEPGEPIIYSALRLDGYAAEELIGTKIVAQIWDEESESSASITFEITEPQGAFE